MAAVVEERTIAVRSTGAALGADVEGIDLARELTPETLDAIKQAWGRQSRAALSRPASRR
jgi:alpha-ketoglutarate-dependent taurine dioxygenase